MRSTIRSRTSIASVSESELIRPAKARDEEAVRAILQANNRRLFRIARGILRNDTEAEDVVQETYFRALTHLDGFRGESSLSTWLSRIAMNEAMGRLRGRRPSLDLDSLSQDRLEAEIIRFPAASNDPEKSMAQRQIQEVVEHAIDRLPAPFRLVVITRVMEEITVEETAELLSLKPETVKTRLHRARALLRQNVEKDRPGHAGGLSFCGPPLRTADGDCPEAAWLFGLTFFGNLRAIPPSNSCAIFHARALVPAPQECEAMFVRLGTALAVICLPSSAAMAQGAKLTDPQIAHIAYTAGEIDIKAAKQAIDKASNKDVKQFAQDMLRDHAAVNKQALDLVKKLKVTPEDNDTSKALSKQAGEKLAELGKLKGAAFDKAYIANEVAYHKTVDNALETQLIPSASNEELKGLLQTGLKIFQGHEQHAEHVETDLK